MDMYIYMYIYIIYKSFPPPPQGQRRQSNMNIVSTNDPTHVERPRSREQCRCTIPQDKYARLGGCVKKPTLRAPRRGDDGIAKKIRSLATNARKGRNA